MPREIYITSLKSPDTQCPQDCPYLQNIIKAVDPDNNANYINVYCEDQLIRGEAIGKKTNGQYFLNKVAFSIPNKEV